MASTDTKVLRLVTTGLDKEPLGNFRVTLAKSEPKTLKTGTRIVIPYQKQDFESAKQYPYLHRFKTEVLPDWKSFFLFLKKLSTASSVSQVFGVPKPEIEKNNLVVQRTKENISFYDHDTEEPITHNYIVIEYDGKENDDYLIKEFISGYSSKTLTPEVIKRQIQHVLRSSFNIPPATLEALPFVFRLSSSFYKSELPQLRVHIIIPTDDFIAQAVAPTLRLINPNFDPHVYRAPNNVLYTASPGFVNKVDPLTLNDPRLDRLYCVMGDNYTRLDINGIIEKLVPGLSAGAGKRHDEKVFVPAWKLDGDAGLFNLSAYHSGKTKTVETWLEEAGYVRKQAYRWCSPTSDSGSPGLMVLPGGYVFDHHENSPIHDIVPHSRRLLSAFDLYYHQAKYDGKLAEFKKTLLQLRSKSPDYKSNQFQKIQTSMLFLTPDAAKGDIDTIVNAIIEDVFNSKIDPREQDIIFEDIKKKTTRSQSPYKVKDIKRIWSGLRHELQESLGNIDPQNPDYVNADAFLRHVNIFYNKVEGFFLLPHPTLPVVTSPSTDLERMIEEHITKTTTSTAWSAAKMASTVLAVKRRAMTTDTEPPEYSKHLFLFQDSFKAVDIFNKEILPIPQTHYVENILPFTLEEYERQLKNPKDAWFKFLDSSLPEKETQLLLQNIFAYLFSPDRKEQKILFLYGVGRSGKSTIKNIVSEFFLTHEFDAAKINDNFILEQFTPITRAIIINEFNSRTANKHTFEKVVNLMKEISGRDPVQVRGLYASYKGFPSDALPIMISNQIPAIKDKAFQSRLIPIKFEHGFDNTQSFTFWRDIQEALPTIFSWAIGQLSEKKKRIRFSKLDKLKCYKAAKTDITLSLDFLQVFCDTYLTPDPEGEILKSDLLTYVRAYYDFMFDAELPTTFPTAFPSVLTLQKYFPSAKLTKGRKRVGNDRIYMVQGVAWKDFEAMEKKLSPFNELIE